MASTSSKSNTKTSTTIKINSPNCGNIVFENPFPSSLWGGGPGHSIVAAPGDPEDLPELFNKVHNTGEGFLKSFAKMFDNLGTDGYTDLAMEILNQITEERLIPKTVVATGIIDEYAVAGKTAEALHVYRMMVDSEHCAVDSEHCAPNAYTDSVIIKALAADPDPNFLGHY